VSSFYGAFPTILFDDLEALAFAVGTIAYIGSFRLWIEERLYEDICFACSMHRYRETSRVDNSLAGFS